MMTGFLLAVSHGPSSDDVHSFLLFTLNGVTAGALYFLVASGFTLIFGLMRVVNLAHGSLYLFGGYLGFTVWDSSGSWVLGVLAGAGAMGLVGLLTQQILLRPIQGQDLRQALVTIGLSIVAADLLLAHYGGLSYQLTAPDAVNGATTLPVVTGVVNGVTSLHMADVIYPTFKLFVFGFAAVVGILLWLMLNRTRLGIIVRAAIDDRDMVSALGINIQVIFALLFALGAALAGLAGVMQASTTSITTGDDQPFLLASLIVVIIGGMGSLGGAAIGALLVGLVEQYALAYRPTEAEVLIFLMMVIVLAVRPQGILGRPA